MTALPSAHKDGKEEDIMENKHTPGKWIAKPANLNPRDPMFYKADVISGGIRVAHVAGIGESCANANAALAAAAPELLGACKAALIALEMDGACIGLVSVLKRTIAKAEGRG